MIFITGAARSGTTLTTGILAAMGLNLGPVNSLNEHLGIREDVTKPFLRALGCDPAGQVTLPDTFALHAPVGLREGIAGQLAGIPDPKGVKDAKFTLIWPAIEQAFPGSRWVIVRRMVHDIADSCARTSFMSAYGKDRNAWQRWAEQYVIRLIRLKEHAGSRAIEVWPSSFIHDPEEFRPVAEHCGLEFNAKHVKDAIDPALFQTH